MPDFSGLFIFIRYQIFHFQLQMLAEMTDIQCCSFKRVVWYGINIKALGSESAVIADYKGCIQGAWSLSCSLNIEQLFINRIYKVVL